MRLQGRESAFMDVVGIFGDGDAAATLPVPRAASGTDASREGGAVNRELPFLVTHWLANFSGANGPGAKCVTDTEKQDAMNRLRRAAADVASAFSALGAYGMATDVSCPSNWFWFCFLSSVIYLDS